MSRELPEGAPGPETPNGATRREPSPASGEAMVEGAIVAGRSPSEAAMGASTTPSPQPQVRKKIPSRADGEPQGPTGVGREAVLKWAVPVLAGAALAVVVWLIRRG